ncbi:phage portal protein [Bacillus toyonensis]|uniref:phage portal protein n=1 Tax=Bacillus toyonensis TaxID=155322 RepID=UPI0020D25B60|nr:phage portal protein [Bacillus toyonensis]
MREGLRERFEKIATLLERMGKSYEEDDIDSLDIVFHYASPVNESDVIDNLIKLHGRSVISDKSIIDITPYITDTYVELERIKQQATARKVVEQPNVSNEGADKEHVTDKSEEVTK